MNKRQKIVQQRFLNNEEAVVAELERTYETALADVKKKIGKLQLDIDEVQGQLDVWDDFGGDEAEKERLQSILRSKVYQKKHQETIQGQLDDVLDKMHTESYATVEAYLNGCYDDAYIGAFYDMHGQGVPLVMPIDQESVVRAVQIDSKISNGLYSRMGEDVSELKKTITAEVSRGVANGSSYAQVAQQISFKMVGAYEDRPGGALYRAMTIARTEGGRIQSQAAMDACYKAKDMGADVVKQWDSTLDGITRPSHRMVDGEIRELDEKFSNGLEYPRDPSGGAAEVVNCRCALLQRARWAIEGGFTKMNNFTKEIETFESPEDYGKFKEAFWSKENQDFMDQHTALEKKYGTKDFKKLLGSMDDEEYAQYMKLYGDSPIYNKAATGAVETAVPKPSFTPAASIEEAQQYADRFVSDYKSKYSGTVDYSGIQVGYANEMNRAFTEVFEAYEPEHPLRNIKPFNMREARFKGTDAEAAYQWGTSDLFFNKGYYKTEKAFNAHLQQYNDLMGQVMPNIDLAIEQYSGATGLGRTKLRYMEALKRTGRTNVYPPDAYGSTVHEMGHYLDDELFRKAMKDNGFDLSISFDGYSGGISAYATSNPQEYVAESFAAYWKGETDILDPDLLKIFEGARKK